MKMVLYEGYTKTAAWRALNLQTKWKNANSLTTVASQSWSRMMRKVKALPTVMKAMGLDTPTLVGKMQQLLNAKKMISSGGSGALMEVDDNTTQLAALELALKKTHPDPPANGGFGVNLNLQANFQIGHPGKEKDNETWEKKAQLVIAPDRPNDGTPTPNSE